MLVFVSVRRPREVSSAEDLERDWYPKHGFGVPTSVINAERVTDPSGEAPDA